MAGCMAIAAALVFVTVGCRETGGGVEAVESLPRSIASESPNSEPVTPEVADPAGNGDGPESILEFGLFGPVVPDLGTEAYESDCNMENDPYETCL